jgi:hypothetical protein
MFASAFARVTTAQTPRHAIYAHLALDLLHELLRLCALKCARETGQTGGT